MGPSATTNYREYESEDFLAVLQMILDTWKFSDWIPGENAKTSGVYYLLEILASSSKVWVATQQDEVVGVIGVKDTHIQNFHPIYELKKSLAYCQIMTRKEGRNKFLQFIQTDGLDQELLHSVKHHFDAELTLLIVKEGHKGEGIGNTLYNTFLNYLNLQRLSNFFVFTDSSCNYPFYEHKGLRREAEKPFYWHDPDSTPTQEEYYLYSGSLERA